MDSNAVNIPGYRILSPLGIGGMASVYLAVQESLDREVALKVMAPALAANEEFTDRFLKEGRITAKLSHPNLVTIFDIGSYGTLYYLAAEYIPGGTLRERLGHLSIAEALDVARDVALGLAYAHEKGFVHRDVKPGNILFRANGTAVLADFGIAKAMNSKTIATQAGNSIGTPHYMSPEQARAEKVDGRSDLYSLGAVLFEMLTGDAPYLADDPFTIALMHVTQPVPVLPEKLAWLQPLVNGLMAKNPDERFHTGDAFVAACDQLLAKAPEAASIHQGRPARAKPVSRIATPSSGQPAVKPGETPRRRAADFAGGERRQSAAGAAKRKPVLIGGAIAVIAIAAIGGWLATRGAGDTPTDTTTTTTPTDATAATGGQVDAGDAPANGGATTPPDAGGDTTADAGDTDANGMVDITPIAPGDVSGLLARADDYVKTGFIENGRRLTSPDGDSAVDLYRQVLVVDPGNAQATAGLSRIADYYETKAKAAFDRGVYSGSVILAEEGLKADPNSPGLQKLLAEARKAAGL